MLFVWICIGTLLFSKNTTPLVNTYQTSHIQTITVKTIGELTDINTSQFQSVIVSEHNGRGGLFMYDPLLSHIDNKGTVIHGWVRQYSGAVNVKWFGATTNAKNTAKQIQAAIDSGALEIFFPSGTYRLNSSKLHRILNLRSNLHLRGEAGTVFDFSHNPIGEHHSVRESYISGQGKVKKVNKITSAARRGSYNIQSDTDGINAGDLVLISSDNTVDLKQPVKIGELIYVESVVNGKSIIFETALSNNYLKNPKIAKVEPLENIIIENIKFIGSGRPQPSGRADLGIVIQYGSNILIKNCEFINVDNTAIDLESVINFIIENNTVRFGKKGKNKAIQYGIKYSNASRDGYIVANNIYNGKHGIVQGHTTLIPGISRNVIISGNNISGTWHAGISVHASGDTISVTGNQLRGCQRGIESRIPNMSIINNILTDIKTTGIMIKDDSSNIIISGNTIERAELYGIFVYKLRSNKGNILIANNLIDNSYGGLAVSAKGIDGVLGSISVNANIFRKMKKHGIVVEGNVSVDITSNILKDITKNAIYMMGNRSAVINANSITNAKIAFRLDASFYKVDNLIISNNIVTDTERFMGKTLVGNKIDFVNNLSE
jgi:parallel beta-helix repeat protein